MGAVEVSVTFRPSLLKKMAESNLNSKNFYGGPLKVVLFFLVIGARREDKPFSASQILVYR